MHNFITRLDSLVPILFRYKYWVDIQILYCQCDSDFGHFDDTQNFKSQSLTIDKSFVVAFQFKRTTTSCNTELHSPSTRKCAM